MGRAEERVEMAHQRTEPAGERERDDSYDWEIGKGEGPHRRFR